ncbi:MAG TPA: MarR family transcriptional regulator [Pseudonocardiaceae bacterium]|nr:MarR family transcriptional regulator [Pseudonocardiaceae bacterium]
MPGTLNYFDVQARQYPGGDHVDRVRQQWAAELPELDTTPLAVVARIGRARNYLDQGMDRLFEHYGLTRQSWDVLACLRRAGPPYRLTPTDLTSAVMRTSGTITHTLHRLEYAGLISRTSSDDDGRSVPVVLTTAGVELVETVAARHMDNERELLSPLDADEQATLAALLRKLLVGMESSPPLTRSGRTDRTVGWT